MSTEKSKVWTYVGCGCGLAVAIGLAAVVGSGWFLYNKGKEFEAALKDPVKREEKSRSLLGYDTLPEGYHAMGGVSIPFVMDMAMLSDRELPAGETTDEKNAFQDHGFIFLRMRSTDADDKKELDDYFAGRARKAGFFDNTGLVLEDSGRDVVRRGELEVNGNRVRYVAEVTRRDGRPAVSGFLNFDCPTDDRMRIGIWFVSTAENLPEAPVEAELPAEYLGTPADPAALQAFLGHFRLCG